MTLYETNAGTPVELGAEFVHGDAPETTRLLDEARLITVPVLGKQIAPIVAGWCRRVPSGSAWPKSSSISIRIGRRIAPSRSFWTINPAARD